MWTDASEQRRLSHDALRVSAYNKTGIPQNLALCTISSLNECSKADPLGVGTVDNTNFEEPTYLPVVHTGILKSVLHFTFPTTSEHDREQASTDY